MIEELLWFLRGETNVRSLQEQGVTIWDEWADEQGELGPVYGRQWRAWATADGGHVDQIARAIHLLRNDPDSRRIIVSAWNVGELDRMALAPCHAFFQCYVADGRLSLQVYQRSADIFLGVPFNIASYALLTHILAQQADLAVGELVWTGGDCHLYLNHLDAGRHPARARAEPLPTLALLRRPADIGGIPLSRTSRCSATSRRPRSARPSRSEDGRMSRDAVAIVAMADNGVIGRGDGLPWHLPDDLKRFKALTMGHALLMGRRTYDSIGRALPGRLNLVLTRNPAWQRAGLRDGGLARRGARTGARHDTLRHRRRGSLRAVLADRRAARAHRGPRRHRGRHACSMASTARRGARSRARRIPRTRGTRIRSAS